MSSIRYGSDMSSQAIRDRARSPELQSVPPTPSTNRSLTTIASSDRGDESTPWRRHDKWRGTSSIFIVVDRFLYELPDHLLEGSTFLANVHADGRLDHATGLSNINPIIVSDVHRTDMDNLLEILDARVLGKNKYGLFDLRDWEGILILASKWGIEAVKSFAIRKFNDDFAHQDPIDRIILAENCGVMDWIGPAEETLVERLESLSDLEAGRLGLPRFADICRRREQNLRSTIAILQHTGVMGAVPVPLSNAVIAPLRAPRRWSPEPNAAIPSPQSRTSARYSSPPNPVRSPVPRAPSSGFHHSPSPSPPVAREPSPQRTPAPRTVNICAPHPLTPVNLDWPPVPQPCSSPSPPPERSVAPEICRVPSPISYTSADCTQPPPVQQYTVCVVPSPVPQTTLCTLSSPNQSSSTNAPLPPFWTSRGYPRSPLAHTTLARSTIASQVEETVVEAIRAPTPISYREKKVRKDGKVAKKKKVEECE